MRLKTGHVIDLDTLKNIQPDSEGDILCPHTREKLDLNNPNIDLELHLLIMKRIQFLLQNDLESMSPQTEDYLATELQLKFIENRLYSVHDQHLRGLEKLQREGKISIVELNRLRISFLNNFGADAVGKADTINGYRAHDMNFDLDWKNIIAEHSKIIFKGTPPTQFIEEI